VYLAPVGAARAPICADCLAQGRGQVNVPDWVKRDLAHAVASVHPAWSLRERESLVAGRLEALAHTPPVPWLQNNEWPVCGDDFAVYKGELTRDKLLAEHRSVEHAKEALHDVIEEVRPEWTLDEEALGTAWEQLGNFVAIFEFQCDAGETVYVVQLA
jgi:hypothetical protein